MKRNTILAVAGIVVLVGVAGAASGDDAEQAPARPVASAAPATEAPAEPSVEPEGDDAQVCQDVRDAVVTAGDAAGRYADGEIDEATVSTELGRTGLVLQTGSTDATDAALQSSLTAANTALQDLRRAVVLEPERLAAADTTYADSVRAVTAVCEPIVG